MDDTEKRLLEAAGKTFAEKGFQVATVREICRSAGANLAAVNYYFRDKERLYRAVLHNAFQCRIDQMAMPQWQPDTPPAQKLRDFIGTVLARMLETHSMPWQMKLLMRELCEPSSLGVELVNEFIRPMYQSLWGILRELLPEDIGDEKLHLLSFSIIGQCFYMRMGRNVISLLVGDESKGYDTARLAAHIADFSLGALGIKPRESLTEDSRAAR
jgi:AcrR family transcriptional regulator